MLKYTGHPLVDVGAATIAAFSERRRLEDVNEGDLEEISGYLLEQYNRPYMNSYLSCVFMNSAYFQRLVADSIARKANRAPQLDAVKQKEYHDFHLFAFRRPVEESSTACGLCGDPAVGFADRQHIPMLTGRGTLNFYPSGQAALPVCAGCMLSIAAMPLGCLRCEGRVLLAHSDNPELTFRFAQENLRHNRRLLQLQGLAEDTKYPDAKQPRTRLVARLRDWASAEVKRPFGATRGQPEPASLSAYHFSNSGQGPSMTIYHLPSTVILFLRDAEADGYRDAWHAIIRSARRIEDDAAETATRNFLYDDLFRLPEEWKRFLRVYFLRRAFRARGKDAKLDPRAEYSLKRDLDLIHWPLTELFVEEIAHMKMERVNAIRDFGDRLATYIAERDAGFWNAFNLARTYGGLRGRLIRVSREEQKAGRPPLLNFDQFITVFEYGEDLPRSDWMLARDLVLIRVIEQLHRRDFFAQHPDALDVDSGIEANEETIPERPVATFSE